MSSWQNLGLAGLRGASFLACQTYWRKNRKWRHDSADQPWFAFGDPQPPGRYNVLTKNFYVSECIRFKYVSRRESAVR